MRQLLITVPRGQGPRVLDLARDEGGADLVRLDGASADRGEVELILAHVPNARVGSLVDRLEAIPERRIAFLPTAAIALRPPADQVADQVADVQSLSPLEVFVSGLQSVGSWGAFLGYAAAGGIVAWIGLVTGSSYLLVAAMLIAPFAGPAMNAAIATARGDTRLLGRSLLRYFASLALSVAVAVALTLVFGVRVPPPMAVDISQVSGLAVLLPLVAGAAGALNKSRSAQDSLVSGAATGLLIAAALAPPAAILGLGLARGEGDLVQSSAFLLMLQLVGVNLGGAAVFRLVGLTPAGPHFARGRRWFAWTAAAASVAALAGLLTWQLTGRPDLQRESRSREAVSTVRQVVDERPDVRLVEAEARFTRGEIAGQDTLLAVVRVQRTASARGTDEQLRVELTRQIQRRLTDDGFRVTPLVDVTVLLPPESSLASPAEAASEAAPTAPDASHGE